MDSIYKKMEEINLGEIGLTAEMIGDIQMTREEAIKVLSDIDKAWRNFSKEEYVALEMAIKALEQEPCEDAIDRDFQIGDEVRIIGSDPIYNDCDVGWIIRNASEKVKTMYVMRNDGSAGEETKEEWYKTGRHNAVLAEVIKALPSVNPQEQKTGHWIEYTRVLISEPINKWEQAWYCSECGYGNQECEDGSAWLEWEYCPYCGAKMEVSNATD